VTLMPDIMPVCVPVYKILNQVFLNIYHTLITDIVPDLSPLGPPRAVSFIAIFDLLNVSRPHLIKLLESKALRYHRTGKHRRIRYDDLMRFKAERDQASEHAMEELARQAQELKLGYE